MYWEKERWQGKYQMLSKKKKTPITLTWKDMFLGKSGGLEGRRGIVEKKEIGVRSSRRSRRQPVKRTYYFLWTISRSKEV
jgi:hypothetical protein